jgi:YD repeat-containing protein
VNYYYDDLNRLTRIDYGDMVIDYTYDDVGNRLTEIMAYPPITTASPSGGVYSSSQSVTLTCTDPQGPGCGNIYYTIDGTTPTTSSQIYSSPILISSNTTLKFFGRDLAGINETVKTQVYTFDLVPPTTSASPAGGTYNTPQTVTLTCADTGGSGCDKVYYTIDGTDPTTSSPVYSAPLNIQVTTTLKFFSRDMAGNSESPVKSQTYTISPRMVTVQLKDSTGALIYRHGPVLFRSLAQFWHNLRLAGKQGAIACQLFLPHDLRLCQPG